MIREIIITTLWTKPALNRQLCESGLCVIRTALSIDLGRTLAQSQNILFDDGGDNCNTNETLLNIFFILIWLSLLST